ncbi:MoxR family ATPase [Gordonia sp. OPL2]|uniref:AAA family ATPase n=1 Tax=Gordonia sp. OPL2 TaxID=2486274 RepID=UPI001655C8BF|nr:MoxR family ATPase [Gordonia sp. OPL2]ROZ89091.1 MoxR family ATPase [Gordonia sp. OPL2]
MNSSDDDATAGLREIGGATAGSTSGSALGSAPGSPERRTSSAATIERALFEMKRVVVGQDEMLERLLVGLLSRGHILLEGVPGIAKTLAVRTVAEVVGGTFRRLQFTPDLMPADIVGTRVWRPSTESFDIELGPVFGNLVLADEINRAPAKVQSALLEAMAERQVSIGGTTFGLPDPFLVLATQNPIETDGVYHLPEAQRDRFLIKVDLEHPTELDEMEILARMGTRPPRPAQILSIDDVVALQDAADDVFVHHAVAHYIVRLVMATRNPASYGVPGLEPFLEYGVSPRGSLGVLAASRALALIRGRDYVLPDDVRELACDVLAHRLVLTFDAVADGVPPRWIVAQVLAGVPAPQIASRDDTEVAS